MRLFHMTLLLLLAAALRIRNLVEFVEWPDEIATLWRSQGSLGNLLSLTPNDWPPLYGVTHWVWVQFTGPTLEASRYLTVLMSLLGIALMYRAARALFRLTHPGARHAHAAALLSAVLASTMAYAIFAGVDLRAYGLLIALGTLGVWLTVRWLRAPTWPRAAAIALLIATMFYTSFTSAAFVAILTLLVIILRPRLFPQWVGIGLGVIVLTLPILPQFYEYGPGRVGGVMDQPVPPFSQAMQDIFRDFGGPSWFLWAILALAVVAAALVARRKMSWPGALLFVFWLSFPVITYVVVDNREFLKPRYMWWVSLGLALFVGYVALHFRRQALWGAIAVGLLLPLVPVDFDNYRMYVTAAPPFRLVFSWFADHLRPGDVLVIDPDCACGTREGWDYFVPQYFPTGYLPIVEEPGDAPRVWYLSTDGWHDESVQAEIAEGRKPSIFVGPWFFLLRLYEGPPSWEGASFDGKVNLHGVEVLDTGTVFAQGESFQVKLWWSAEEGVDLDYSIGVGLMDAYGNIVTQVDGPAQYPDTPEQTSAWQPGVVYEDIRTLQAPDPIPRGMYSLYVIVYQWWDGTRLPPEENALWPISPSDDTALEVQQLYGVGKG